jgi:DNA-binding transcriptional LysR family regulator
MQVEALKVFCDIVRLRSFSLAARENDRTQSAASQIVRELEERLAVQLIDRSTRPLQLTPVGQVYYDGVKRLIEQYLELEASIRQAQAKVATTVQVAAIYSVGLSDMGQVVERFEEQYPSAKVHLEYLHPDRVYEKVLAGTADLGLLSWPRKMRELASLPWRDEEMVLTCAPGHPLARLRSIRPAQLTGEKYISFDKGLVIRREVDRFLREQDAGVQSALEFDNIETIKQAVAIDAGVALLPAPTVRREVEAGTLMAIPLAGCRFVRPLGIIHRKRRPLTATARHFIELLRSLEASASARNGKPHSHAPSKREG